MRTLLDTNLLVCAAITPEGLARKILDHIGAKDEYVLILSAHLLSEVADVLSRPRIRARWPLSDDEIQTYCQYLSAAGQEVKIQPLPPVISDPKGQAVVEAAVCGKADAICTSDAHFFKSPATEFLAERGIAVLSDVDLIAVLDEVRQR